MSKKKILFRQKEMATERVVCLGYACWLVNTVRQLKLGDGWIIPLLKRVEGNSRITMTIAVRNDADCGFAPRFALSHFAWSHSPFLPIVALFARYSICWQINARAWVRLNACTQQDAMIKFNTLTRARKPLQRRSWILSTAIYAFLWNMLQEI